VTKKRPQEKQIRPKEYKQSREARQDFEKVMKALFHAPKTHRTTPPEDNQKTVTQART